MKIERIGALPRKTSAAPRDGAAPHAPGRASAMPPAPHARADARPQRRANPRINAGFLAQYVDQHWPWPRAPFRKEKLRQRATSAYIAAGTLPDLLAETLRLHPVDRRL